MNLRGGRGKGLRSVWGLKARGGRWLAPSFVIAMVMVLASLVVPVEAGNETDVAASAVNRTPTVDRQPATRTPTRAENATPTKTATTVRQPTATRTPARSENATRTATPVVEQAGSNRTPTATSSRSDRATATKTPTTATQCVPNPEAHLTGHITGVSNGIATGVVVNSSTLCSYSIGVASYRIPSGNPNDSDIDSQIHFHSSTATINHGASSTITARVPSCAYQLDLFYGDLLNSFNGARYGTRLLDSDRGGSGTCTQGGARTPTLTPVLEQSIATSTPTRTRAAVATATKTPTNSPQCVPNAAADMTGHITGISNGVATGVLTNNSRLCSYDGGIATYRIPSGNPNDGNIDVQIFYDGSETSVPPRSSRTLTVQIPSCAYQLDLFYGDLLTSLNGVRYGTRLLDTGRGGSGACAEQNATRTPTPTRGENATSTKTPTVVERPSSTRTPTLTLRSTATKTPTVNPECVPNPERHLTGTITGTSNGVATGVIHNDSSLCSYLVGMASYKIPSGNPNDSDIDSQIFFDGKSTTLVPRGSTTLTVRVPSCAYQLDLFYGEVLQSLNGFRYGDRLLDTERGGMGICSEPTATATQTSTVEARATSTPTRPARQTATTVVQPSATRTPPTDHENPTATRTATSTRTATPTKTATPNPLCVPNPDAHLTGTITGTTNGVATGVIMNSSDVCSYLVGMASYRIPSGNPQDSDIDSQIFFDSDVATVPQGRTTTLTVRVPPCAYQLDLFYGEVLPSLNGHRYGDRLLDTERGGTGICAERVPTQTPTAVRSLTPTTVPPTEVPGAPTATATPIPPTSTATTGPERHVPSSTPTTVPPTEIPPGPTSTATTVPPTEVPPAPTSTATSVPPVVPPLHTATATTVPPTQAPPAPTSTSTAVPTEVPAAPTATPTTVPPTEVPGAPTATPTTVPPTATEVPCCGGHPVQPTYVPTATSTVQPVIGGPIGGSFRPPQPPVPPGGPRPLPPFRQPPPPGGGQSFVSNVLPSLFPPAMPPAAPAAPLAVAPPPAAPQSGVLGIVDVPPPPVEESGVLGIVDVPILPEVATEESQVLPLQLPNTAMAVGGLDVITLVGGLLILFGIGVAGIGRRMRRRV